LAGGWLGVPRDPSLGTPSQPPGKAQPNPCIRSLNGYLAPDFLRLENKGAGSNLFENIERYWYVPTIWNRTTSMITRKN